MNESLQTTLDKLIQSDTKSNPALNLLVNDYTKYHVLFVVVAGVFLLVFALLNVFFWRRFKRIPKTDSNKWAFEKKTYFNFGILSLVVGLFLALIFAANLSNVLNPRQGFSGTIGMIQSPVAGSPNDKLHQEINTWLVSGGGTVPPTLQSKVDDRLAWQRPKAIICTVLLAIFTIVTARIWRKLIRKSRVRESKWLPQDRLLHFAGIAGVTICLLLMLMVIGNTQAAFAPMSLTLFYG